MATLYSRPPPTWKAEENESDAIMPDLTPMFYGVSSQSSFGSAFHYPDSSSSTIVDQAYLYPADVQDHSSLVLPSDFQFDLSDSDTFALISLEQYYVPWVSSDLGFALTEVPGMCNVIRNNIDATWGSVSTLPIDPPPVSHTTNSGPQASCFQNAEDGFRNTAGFCVFPIAGSPPGSSIGQAEAQFTYANPSIPDSADPAPLIDTPSYTKHFDIPFVDQDPQAAQNSYNTASPTSELPAAYCLWSDGEVCGEEIDRDTLPGHLAKHGIQKKTRNHPTRCNWLGCKMKKTMNRESIVRHIREVHLRLKRRSTKQAQDLYPSTLDCDFSRAG